MTSEVDVVVIGGGQAGLAAGFHLRRAGLDFVILDQQDQPGGAWQHYWDSLRLFSPAEHSRLPGWPMPPQPGEVFPTAAHVVDYLTRYEERYDLPVRRPVRVDAVRDAGERLAVHTDAGTWHARIVISATGSWEQPHIPNLPGAAEFPGTQLHTVDYRRPEPFAGQHVVIVGGANSAAQILADVSTVADTTWATLRPPRFMPDDIDGRILFDVATQHAVARREGREALRVSDLGDIIMVPSVLDARDRDVLHAVPMFDRITADGIAWADGTHQPCDAIIWCTGFTPDLRHLDSLSLTHRDGLPRTEGTRSVDEPRLYLMGYGDWTGAASATIIGAARTAKPTVADIVTRLS